MRRIRVDADGGWHLQRAGRWLAVRPDRFAFGTAGLWLHVSGPVLAGAADGPRRLSATVWRALVAPDAWRRLQVAARWHAERARDEATP